MRCSKCFQTRIGDCRSRDRAGCGGISIIVLRLAPPSSTTVKKVLDGIMPDAEFNGSDRQPPPWSSRSQCPGTRLRTSFMCYFSQYPPSIIIQQHYSECLSLPDSCWVAPYFSKSADSPRSRLRISLYCTRVFQAGVPIYLGP